MKILYCINTIGVIGGTERVTIVKANALADIDGMEVGICFTDRGDYPHTVHPLSPKVKIFDLSTPYWELDTLWKVATGYLRKVYDGHRALSKVIDNFQPDILVTTGGNERHFVTLTSRKSPLYDNIRRPQATQNTRISFRQHIRTARGHRPRIMD